MLERLKPLLGPSSLFTFIRESRTRETTDESTFIDKKYGVNVTKSILHELGFERAKTPGEKYMEKLICETDA